MLRGAQREVVALGQAHDVEGVWMKARLDLLNLSRGFSADLKVIGTSAHPVRFERHAHDEGMYIQAAWQRDTLRNAGAANADSLNMFIIAVERDPPHVPVIYGVSGDALALGAQDGARARAVWARCLNTGQWPGYRAADKPDSDGPIWIGLPRYALRQEEDRAQYPRVITDLDLPRMLEVWKAAQAPLEKK